MLPPRELGVLVLRMGKPVSEDLCGFCQCDGIDKHKGSCEVKTRK